MADEVELEDFELDYLFVKRFDNGRSAAIAPLTFGRVRIVHYESWSIFDGW